MVCFLVVDLDKAVRTFCGQRGREAFFFAILGSHLLWKASLLQSEIKHFQLQSNIFDCLINICNLAIYKCLTYLCKFYKIF